jgi:hypothetical protein
VKAVKVTIDSSEPLADALRVVGALYNVNLARVDEPPAIVGSKASTAPRRSNAKGNASGPKTAKKTAPRSAAGQRKTTAALSSEIRQWASANGHAVSSRGTLPASIKAAYAAAHGGQ